MSTRGRGRSEDEAGPSHSAAGTPRESPLRRGTQGSANAGDLRSPPTRLARKAARGDDSDSDYAPASANEDAPRRSRRGPPAEAPRRRSVRGSEPASQEMAPSDAQLQTQMEAPQKRTITSAEGSSPTRSGAGSQLRHSRRSSRAMIFEDAGAVSDASASTNADIASRPRPRRSAAAAALEATKNAYSDPFPGMRKDKEKEKGKGKARALDKGKQKASSVGADAEAANGEGEAKPELTEEERKLKAEEELFNEWTQEYHEIVDQLPLELSRSFALMRELEDESMAHQGLLLRQILAYRDERNRFKAWVRLQAGLQNGDASHAGPSRVRQASEGAEKADRSEAAPPPADVSMEDDADADGEADPDAEGAEDVTFTIGMTEGSAPNSRPTSSHGRPAPATSALSSPNNKPAPATAPAAKKPSEFTPDASQRRRARQLASILTLSSAMVSAAEEKCGLATSMYETIDRHVQVLDSELQKCESELAGISMRQGTSWSGALREAQGLEPGGGLGGPDAPGGPDAKARKRKAGPGAAAFDNDSPAPKQLKGLKITLSRKGAAGAASQPPPPPQGKQKKGRVGQIMLEEGIVPAPPVSALGSVLAGTAQRLAGEPTYCYCDKVSFGSMIQCDNAEGCPIEWFHWACVGLVAEPRAKWYCAYCRPPAWKGPGQAVPPDAPRAPPQFKSAASASSAGKKGRRR